MPTEDHEGIALHRLGIARIHRHRSARKRSCHHACCRAYGIKQTGETPVTQFLTERAVAAYRIVDDHLRQTPFLMSARPTLADLSLAGYVYMPEETGMPESEFPHMAKWKDRIRDLSGWRHPYDLMPGPTSL
ncbi:glutathione binding-like protein [Rhizobium sp. TRM95111]|uniref:glutathione S-transferase family protein n=1 Tax=Rhizobium alarense TaxID=2846851 RepID=UPI001F2D0474|nr:glutathione binding-like protein [Rhizobium alarense]MCF3642000.1 glutathione binding-like protein [Rhizobium alarense]